MKTFMSAFNLENNCFLFTILFMIFLSTHPNNHIKKIYDDFIFNKNFYKTPYAFISYIFCFIKMSNLCLIYLKTLLGKLHSRHLFINIPKHNHKIVRRI
jgi:predicted membrane protein